VLLAIKQFRLAEKNNATRLPRIWVRLQGASAGAYLGYVPVDATPWTSAKTSKVKELFFSVSLSPMMHKKGVATP
jgi:hypothetical protein